MLKPLRSGCQDPRHPLLRRLRGRRGHDELQRRREEEGTQEVRAELPGAQAALEYSVEKQVSLRGVRNDGSFVHAPEVVDEEEAEDGVAGVHEGQLGGEGVPELAFA